LGFFNCGENYLVNNSNGEVANGKHHETQNGSSSTVNTENGNSDNNDEKDPTQTALDRKFSDSYEYPSDQEVTHISINQVRKMSDHVLYQILVTNSHKRASFRQWIQLKRFTQFYEMDCSLRSSIIAEHPSFDINSLAPTPPRRLKFIHDHMDDDFIEERRVLLENYLSHLLRIPEVANNQSFLDFLGVGIQ